MLHFYKRAHLWQENIQKSKGKAKMNCIHFCYNEAKWGKRVTYFKKLTAPLASSAKERAQMSSQD